MTSSTANVEAPRHAAHRDVTTAGRGRWIAALVGPPIAAVAIGVWDPDRSGGPPLCPLRACTGIACPGCGLTRATGALLRGRAGDAMHVHPFAVALVTQAALLWLLVLAGRGRLPAWLPQRVIVAMVTLNAVALVGIWALRLWTGWIDVVS
ncbi:MAG TPA: DUF2752 domain-containing protein [Acidimicrobiales bacterium]